MQSMYKSISSLNTQQEIADAIIFLEEANKKIENPVIQMEHLKQPSTNLNRKGRKSKKGVKRGTKRLEIARELFEKSQEKDIKIQEKKKKEDEEYERKKRMIEIEERFNLQQKKKKTDSNYS